MGVMSFERFGSAPALFLSSLLQSVQFEYNVQKIHGNVWVQGFGVHKHAVAGVSACLAISHLVWF